MLSKVVFKKKAQKLVGVRPGEQLGAILRAASNAMEAVRPDIGADVSREGVTLTGGGAYPLGLPKLASEVTTVSRQAAATPLSCVVKGGGKILPQIRQQNFQKISEARGTLGYGTSKTGCSPIGLCSPCPARDF